MELTDKEIELFRLIKSDEAARNIFFSKVDDPKFFYTIKEEGYFDSETVPRPIQVEEGFQIPIWPPIIYLQKLSLKFREGHALDLVDELLEIIRFLTDKLDDKTIDNPRLYYFFANITANVPNEKISLQVLKELLTKWLKVGDSFYTSPEIIEQFIPKFLPDVPTEQDKEKALWIVSTVLSAKYYLTENNKRSGKRGFHRDIYWLDEIILNKRFYERIAEQLPTSIIFFLADQLRLIISSGFLNSEFEFTLNDATQVFNLDVFPDQLRVTLNTDAEHQIIVDDFEHLSESLLTKSIISKLKEKGLSFSNSNFEERLANVISFGLNGDPSIYRLTSFYDEDEEAHKGYDVESSFSSFLVKICEHACSMNESKGKEIIDTLLGEKYKNPIFKRLAIYLIGKSWGKYNLTFWSMLKTDFKERLFNEHSFNKEIYYLLKKNALSFSSAEKTLIKSIIDQGPSDQKHIEYWKLNWLSALREVPEFTSSYSKLSKQLSIDSSHFEDSGKIQIRSGEESPYAIDELLTMDLDVLIEKIKAFTPSSWLGPSVSGFSRALEKAISQNPGKFVDGIEKFVSIPYPYAYAFFSGLTESWKARLIFDWQKVLSFCKTYITSSDFTSGKLSLREGSWTHAAESVEGAFGHLIEEGTRSDDWAFDLSLITEAEEILGVIIERSLNGSDETKQGRGDVIDDYPMFAINTILGKLFRALLDCALRNKRNKVPNSWKALEKRLFDLGVMKKSIEVQVVIGWYYRQFFFLDEVWIKDHITSRQLLENDESRRAFMGGFLFSNPPRDKAVFQLMVSHYSFVIENRFFPRNAGAFNSGLVTHLCCYYLWSFEDLTEGSLIKKIIDVNDQRILEDLIRFFRISSEDLGKSGDQEKAIYQDRILSFWKYLNNHVKSNYHDTNKRIDTELGDLIVNFDDLNEDIFQLCQSSIKLGFSNHGTHFILSHFAKILKDSSSSKNAVFISKLFLEILSFTTPHYEQTEIKLIVTELYKYKETKNTADQICEIYLKRDIQFLREIYKQQNAS